MASTKDNPTIETLGVSEETLPEQEMDIVAGLMKAAEFTTDLELQRLVKIERAGVPLFQFTIRPLSEPEIQKCRAKATPKVINPLGRHLPKVDGDVDFARVRSYKIYEATIPEDRARVWDNPTIKQQFNVIEGADVIDRCLLGGEKDAVDDIIDNISGYGTSGVTMEEFAKN